MKKLGLLIFVAALAALAIWASTRANSAKSAVAATELLPKGTLVFLTLPDFQRAQAQWRASDLYQLFHEPALEAFLRRPLSTIPQKSEARQTIREFAQLAPKNAFLALTDLTNNEPKIATGFQFSRTQQEAESVVGNWRAQLLAKFPGGQPASLLYGTHRIETIAAGRFTIGSVFSGPWFLVANDVTELKAILDRADRHSPNAEGSLKTDPAFAAALKHMPAGSTAMFYLRPGPFVERLLPLMALTGQPLAADQLERLKQIKSFCAAFGFDGGKMREVDFLGTPRREGKMALRNLLLPLASADSFLYGATLMGSAADFRLPALGLWSGLQSTFAAMGNRGLTAEDWSEAFGDEAGIIGEWKAENRWPAFTLALPVKDHAKAQKIVSAITVGTDESVSWTTTEKAGASYYALQSFGGLVPIAPTIALSENFLIGGLDSGSVEEAINRSTNPSPGLAKSATYQSTAVSIPAADRTFAYLDTALLFNRLDAAFRPLLVMSAAFSSGQSGNFDFAHLPPAESITKHLSPIVLSQRYEKDGYVTESIGPVTMHEAVLAALALVAGNYGGGLAQRAQDAIGDWTQPQPPNAAPAPSTSPVSSPTDNAAPSPE